MAIEQPETVPVTRTAPLDEPLTVELITETVTVSKRDTVRGKVRIEIQPVVERRAIEVDLQDDDVVVDRVPVGRFVDAAPDIRQDGETTIYPVLEERAVVTVRLFLKEELHVRRQVTQRTERHDVTLHSQRATINRSDETPATVPSNIAETEKQR